MAPQTLTEYERRRLENIKRNDEMMASLKIQLTANQLSSSTKRSRNEIKGYRNTQEKKPKNESPIVIRRSLRARGIPPDAATSKGLEDDLGTTPQKTHELPSNSDPSVRMSETLSMEQAYDSGSSNRQFIDTVLGMRDNAPLGWRKKYEDEDGDFFQLDSFALKPENIARIVPERILSVRFFPFGEKRVIAAGDKLGHVGFWDVDCKGDKGDGVYIYSPHSAPVSGISIQLFALTKIFTSSYDGFIRLMDVGNESFNKVYSSDDAIFSLAQRLNDVKSLYFGVGEAGSMLKVWDERAGVMSSSYLLHTRRINSIDFNPERPHLMATSSSDGTACIWDLRNLSNCHPKSLKVIEHEKAVHSAYFSPGGAFLATTSYDNTIRLLSGVDLVDKAMIHHNNQTGRWISSFRVEWGWDDSYFFVGNLSRAVDVISTSDRRTSTLRSLYMTAIPSRFAAHPFRVGNLACTTAGGQVYMWTTS